MTKTPEPTSKPPPADDELTAMLDIIEHGTSGLIED